MKIQSGLLPFAICAATVFGAAQGLAQTVKNQENVMPVGSQNPTEMLAVEIGQLRKTMQALTTRLREMGDKYASTDLKAANLDEKKKRMLLNFDILSRAEQRAEVLRKQLIELLEKENSIKTRLTQIDEDMRPENIERTTNTFGSTRAPELRETRRKSLEQEKAGLRALVSQIEASRLRLEDDVRDADLLVQKLRQRVLPAIEKQVEEINEN